MQMLFIILFSQRFYIELLIEHFKVAKLYVKVDLTKPLPCKVISGFSNGKETEIAVSYPWLPLKCELTESMAIRNKSADLSWVFLQIGEGLRVMYLRVIKPGRNQDLPDQSFPLKQ